MELISVSFVHHNVINQYGNHKMLRGKINNYFHQFIDKYKDFDYAWVDEKLYIDNKHGWQIKKDIEKLLNKPIKPIYTKIFGSKYNIKFIDVMDVKKKIEQKKIKKDYELEIKHKSIKQEFYNIIDKIKKRENGYRYIGSFDLEFWEHNMNLLLEFGWSIVDYHGKTHTTHLIVQENLKYENGQFSKNNRFARKDSQTVPLKVALRRFKEEFLDKVEVLVGHGLTNDFKVLKLNGLDLNLEYIDTSDIGSVIMGETDKVSLSRLLDYLKIEHDDLHNAANDVEFILKAFFELGNL